MRCEISLEIEAANFPDLLQERAGEFGVAVDDRIGRLGSVLAGGPRGPARRARDLCRRPHRARQIRLGQGQVVKAPAIGHKQGVVRGVDARVQRRQLVLVVEAGDDTGPITGSARVALSIGLYCSGNDGVEVIP